MNTDQSILSSNQQEVKDYLNNLAEAVCINGESLEKYEKVVTKQYGEEVYNNMKMFVEEVQGYVKRKSFTNTSKMNIGYLGKNAGLNEQTINSIIQHYEDQFDKQERSNGFGCSGWLCGFLVVISVLVGCILYNAFNKAEPEEFPTDEVAVSTDGFATDRYTAVENAIEGATKPDVRQIWDGHQIGDISLDKTHDLVEFEYLITGKHADDPDWIESEIREKGISDYTMCLIANFVMAYEYSTSEDDSDIHGEHNPPLYRAIKEVLDEAQQAGLGIAFNIKDKNGESFMRINCDSADLNTAMTNWEELH